MQKGLCYSARDELQVGLSDVICNSLSLLTKGVGQQEDETERVSDDVSHKGNILKEEETFHLN